MYVSSFHGLTMSSNMTPHSLLPHSHIWYKMLRAEIPQMCFMDFLKYGAQTGKELDNYFAVLFGGKVDSDDKNVTPGGS